MRTMRTMVRMAALALLLGLSLAARASALDYADAVKSYQYDKTKPLNIVIRETKEFATYDKIFFSYDSPNGGRVPAVLVMPKAHVKPFKAEKATVPGAYPVIFFMHFHVSDKSLVDVMLNWTGYGFAIMAIDGVYRGERKVEGQDILMADPFVSEKHIAEQTRDILRGFDVIAQWKGLDPGRIGYMGISMGSVTGTAACAMDPRIKAIVLADGGANFPEIFITSDYGQVQEMKAFIQKNKVPMDKVKAVFDYVDPATFAPHLDPRPVLMLNGKKDTTFPVPVVKELYDAVNAQTKKQIWYDSGHVLPFDKLLFDAQKWFRTYL